MKKFILVSMLIMTHLLLPGYVLAFCSEPVMAPMDPSPGRPIAPTLPYCASSFSGHTCDDYQVISYNGELDSYLDELQRYIDIYQEYHREATTFANEAIEYAQCEARNMPPRLSIR